MPVTHAAILAAVETLPEHAGPAEAADHICRMVGVDVPLKAEPWEVAYETWQDTPGDGRYLTRDTWRAAVEWCVEQALAAIPKPPADWERGDFQRGYANAAVAARNAVMKTIMGQEQQP